MSDSEEKRSDELLPTQTTHLQEYPRSLGVRKIELVSTQCKSWYIRLILFFNILLISYVCELDAGIRQDSYSFAIAGFSNLGLLLALGVVKVVIRVATPPSFARLSDHFGRLTLLIVVVIFYVVGTVIVSQALNTETFCAGEVLYTLGRTGVASVILFIVADFSNLNWRLLCIFVTTIPYVINTWIIRDIFLSILTPDLKWSYATWIFAIIVPCSCIPLTCTLVYMMMKARKTAEWKVLVKEEAAAKQRMWVSLKQNMFVTFFWNFDLVGVVTLMSILGLIAASLAVGGGAERLWAQASAIVPLILGIVLIPIHIWWDKNWARRPSVPWPLLTDRGVWGALLIGVFVNVLSVVSHYFLTLILVVGFQLTTLSEGRVVFTYKVAVVFTSFLLGIVVVFIKKAKGFIVFGACLSFIAHGLYLHFSNDIPDILSDKFINGAIGSLCLMGFSAGLIIYPTQVSIASVTSHEYMATVIGLYESSLSLGSSLGTSLAVGVWTSKAYDYIVDEFTKAGIDPDLARDAYFTPFAFSYQYYLHSPELIALATAYARCQRNLCIVGITLCVPLLVATLFTRDHRLAKVQSLELNQIDEKDENNVVVVHRNNDDKVAQVFSKMIGKKST